MNRSDSANNIAFLTYQNNNMKLKQSLGLSHKMFSLLLL